METRKKKILFVITKSVWGGAQKYVFGLATNLPDRFDSIVAAGGNGPLIEKLLQNGIKPILIPRLEKNLGFVKDLRAAADLFSLYIKEEPEIIHLNSSKAGGLGAFVAWLYKRIYRKRVVIVFTAHGWPFSENRALPAKVMIFILSWLTAFFCDQIITISKIDFKRTRLFWPIRKNKFKYIPNGIEKIYFVSKEDARNHLEKHLSRSLDNKKLLIGTVAELTKNKGLPYLIAALDQIRNLNFECIIIGSGEEKNLLAAFVKKNNLEDRIFFSGFIDHAERLLKAFDIFILPSVKEGLPYTILEALSAGLPIVATDVGGIPDLITDRHDGMLVAPQNSQELARALNSIITNNELRKSLGEEALKSSMLHDEKVMINKITTFIYDSR